MKNFIKNHFNLFSFILITVVTLIAYSNTFQVPIQFDDGAHIRDSQKIRDLSNYFTLDHWKGLSNRPLAFFTLAVNYQISHLDTTSYHIYNIIIHILAGFFAYLLTFEILSSRLFRKKYPLEVKKRFALFVALIFIAHPIQTQAVTYIVQRMSSMAGMFYLLSCYLYLKGRYKQVDNDSFKNSILFYVLAFGAGVLGIMSKQNVVTFPIAWLLMEFYLVRDTKKAIYKRYLIVSTIGLAAFIIVGILLYGLPEETDRITRGNYMITQLRAFLKYLQLLIIPYGQNLDHRFLFSDEPYGTDEFLSGLFTLAVVVGGVLLYKRNKIISFGIFWYFITASVESSFIPIRDAIFEHRMYLPFFGFSLIVTELIVKYVGRKKISYATIALAALTAVYVALAFNRNMAWQTTESIWLDSTKKSPDKERNWYWLGAAYMERKNFQKAEYAFTRAVTNNPSFYMAFNARGNVRKDLENYQGAIEDYDNCLKLNPNFIKAYYNRGISHAKIGQYQEAILDYNKAEKKRYLTDALLYNRGNSKMRINKVDAAIKDYNRCLSMNSLHALAYYNRGLAYAKKKKHQTAIQDFEQAISLDNKNKLFYNGRGVSYIHLKNYELSIDDFTKSIKLDPKNGQAFYNRGYAKYFGLKDYDGACEDWQLAVKLNYGSARSLFNRYCKSK